MSLIQEFIDEQINKNPSSIIIQQLQTSHSAVQLLLLNLQSLRQMPKLQYINERIQKLSIFLQAKEKILSIIQRSQNQNVSEWLITQKISSPIIIQLIQKEHTYVDQMINKLIKKIFLGDQKLQQYLEEIQLVNYSLAILNSIKDDIQNNKTPNRQKIKIIDARDNEIIQRIKNFQTKGRNFALEIDSLAQQLYSYQTIIIHQFKSYFIQKVQPKMLIAHDQQEINIPFEVNIPQSQASNNLYQANYVKGNHGNSFISQGKSNFRPQMSQSWRVGKMNKNEISNLGLNSQINDHKRNSKLSRFEQLKVKSGFGVR